MFEELSHIKPEMFSDPQVQKAMTILLNVIETQQKQLNEQKILIQELRDEIARLKGEKGKPIISPNTKKDISSQKHTQTSKNWTKQSKKDKMTFDNTLICALDTSNLPKDLVRKGTETVVSQDIIFKRNTTQYVVEIWYSPSENKTYRAPLPADYNGYFGNDLKAFCQVANRVLDVTQNKLLAFLRSFGIYISSGSLQNILSEKAEMWCNEKNDLLRAGLKSPFLQTDSTKARVHGQNHKTHVFVSDFFAVFTTMPSKSRLDILRALQGQPEAGLFLQHNPIAQDFLGHYNISITDKAIVQSVFAQNTIMLQCAFEDIITTQYPKLPKKTTTYKWIIESLAFGYYFEQTQFAATPILLTDDAKEYQLLAQKHALCWVHDGRYYTKLSPILEQHRQILEQFNERYWAYYARLKKYTQGPLPELKEKLSADFDALFKPNTGYYDLNKEIERTLANKQELLVVLDHPFVPLHNNAAELAARRQVRKRDISLHTMTEMGTKLQDAFLSIIHTSFQLGVNVYQYIFDRINNTATFYLPDLVKAKINSS